MNENRGSTIVRDLISLLRSVKNVPHDTFAKFMCRLIDLYSKQPKVVREAAKTVLLNKEYSVSFISAYSVVEKGSITQYIVNEDKLNIFADIVLQFLVTIAPIYLVDGLIAELIFHGLFKLEFINKTITKDNNFIVDWYSKVLQSSFTRFSNKSYVAEEFANIFTPMYLEYLLSIEDNALSTICTNHSLSLSVRKTINDFKRLRVDLVGGINGITHDVTIQNDVFTYFDSLVKEYEILLSYVKHHPSVHAYIIDTEYKKFKPITSEDFAFAYRNTGINGSFIVGAYNKARIIKHYEYRKNYFPSKIYGELLVPVLPFAQKILIIAKYNALEKANLTPLAVKALTIL